VLHALYRKVLEKGLLFFFFFFVLHALYRKVLEEGLLSFAVIDIVLQIPSC